MHAYFYRRKYPVMELPPPRYETEAELKKKVLFKYNILKYIVNLFNAEHM